MCVDVCQVLQMLFRWRGSKLKSRPHSKQAPAGRDQARARGCRHWRPYAPRKTHLATSWPSAPLARHLTTLTKTESINEEVKKKKNRSQRKIGARQRSMRELLLAKMTQDKRAALPQCRANHWLLPTGKELLLGEAKEGRKIVWKKEKEEEKGL